MISVLEVISNFVGLFVRPSASVNWLVLPSPVPHMPVTQLFLSGGHWHDFVREKQVFAFKTPKQKY